jgi:hypothetical protein
LSLLNSILILIPFIGPHLRLLLLLRRDQPSAREVVGHAAEAGLLGRARLGELAETGEELLIPLLRDVVGEWGGWLEGGRRFFGV